MSRLIARRGEVVKHRLEAVGQYLVHKYSLPVGNLYTDEVATSRPAKKAWEPPAIGVTSIVPVMGITPVMTAVDVMIIPGVVIAVMPTGSMGAMTSEQRPEYHHDGQERGYDQKSCDDATPEGVSRAIARWYAIHGHIAKTPLFSRAES